MNTLIRALSQSPYSIGDAAANYPCHPVVRILKMVLSLGLTEAYDHYYNLPSKRDAVADLRKSLDNPQDSWFDNVGTHANSFNRVQVVNEFEFEKQTYRVTDLRRHWKNTDLKKKGDLRSDQEFMVLERLIKTEKGMRWTYVELVDGSVEKLKARAHVHVQPPVEMFIPKSPDKMYNGL